MTCFYQKPQTDSWKIAALVVGVVLFFVVLIGGTAAIRTVPVGHVGIVTSFGSVTGQTLEPGMHLVFPWHAVTVLDTRIQNYTTKTECFSKDLQLLQVQLNIMTSLPKSRAQSVFTTVGPDYANQVVPRVFEILKQEVSKYTAELVIENREIIRSDVLAACRTRLAELVEFQDVVLTNVDFSDAYERAIESKQVAQQESLKARYELEKAKIEAEKAVATAEGEAESIRIKGEALKNSPGMAQLEAIRKWNGVAPTHVFLSGDDSNVPVVFPVR